jgi:hypothetical protein
MGVEVGQTSHHQPAVVRENSQFHMVFSANDPSNRILYATSPNGSTDWRLVGDTGQTSGAAPALCLSYLPKSGHSRLWNLLVLVFVANDPSNRILYSILDLNEDPNTRGWRYVGQVGNESARAVFALGVGEQIICYFTANDPSILNPSNRLLSHVFNPLPG